MNVSVWLFFKEVTSRWAEQSLFKQKSAWKVNNNCQLKIVCICIVLSLLSDRLEQASNTMVDRSRRQKLEGQHAVWRVPKLSWHRREGRGSVCKVVTFVAAARGCECSLDLTQRAQRCGFPAWLSHILTERPVRKRGCVTQMNHFEDVWGILFCSLFT